jgi:hypothetical protein
VSDTQKAIEEVLSAPFGGILALGVGISLASAKAKAKYGDALDDDNVPEPLSEFLDWLIEGAEDYAEALATQVVG